ncbi:Kappa-carrageenase precursor [Rubripirellula lacrimiformis]|uniref:Kappa-carrageenase n=1 Tax=Rubripirellula lacrimiformis TaxID=1930273 RepID=A0A517NCW3_9BACT|nr:kappa-carrageenase [Rubripirellula lacrimiformis]QDT04946.1 Kappa-carrageenase precursor [Rubripirellula lacrimiformis]
MNRISIVFVVILQAAIASSADPVPLRNAEDANAAAWKFVQSHSDEFDGDQVDRQKWNIDTKDFGPWSWDPANVAEKDGSLHLRMVQSGHRRGEQELHYTSGMARNDQTITYGYFEARIKGCSRYPGACPSFWLYSISPQNRFQASDGETVAYSEIDVVELQQSEFDSETKSHYPVTRIDCNLHTVLIKDGKRQWFRPHSAPDLCRSYVDSTWDPRADYHVYGVHNTRETITWYIDGVEVAKKPNLYWHLPMHVTLSLGLRYPFVGYQNGDRVAVQDATTGDGFPTHMSVDYVRVWQQPGDFESRIAMLKSKSQSASKSNGSDWTWDQYVEHEQANWKQNGWQWNAEQVKSNFDQIDRNGDGLASGIERRDWYEKKSKGEQE